MAKKLIFINTQFIKKICFAMNYDNDEPLYSISTAAKLLSISVHTLRMYEREGLIIPFKKESRHRLFSQSDIQRVICIRHAINNSKISIAGIQTIFSLIPCWEMKGCTQKERMNCKAFNNHSKPCWMFRHIDNSCSEKGCRECVVYKDYAECGKIKESIINLSGK